MTTKISGQLEIDHDRGVVYFHSRRKGTMFRICGLPRPIPKDEMLDVTHMVCCGWGNKDMIAAAAWQKIRTTYPVMKIPFVPNAVAGMPFNPKPVRR